MVWIGFDIARHFEEHWQNAVIFFYCDDKAEAQELICNTVKPRTIVPGSIIQFLWSLNKSCSKYGNKICINHSSIYHFPASVGQNF
jgi:hypothetical protein